MALTSNEELYVQKSKQIVVHEKEIADISITAGTSIATKQSEITTLESTRQTDVAAKQALIDTLKAEIDALGP